MDLRKKQSVKACMLIITIGIGLILLIFLASPPSSPYANIQINDENDLVYFLAELGWETDSTNITAQNSILPEEFDAIFEEYNSLQLQQNCDLTAYAGKEITVYTIPIKNYGNTAETVYATVIVHKNTVIGGDIHSAQMDGFMHTLS